MGNERYYSTHVFDVIITAMLKTEGTEETKVATIEAIIRKFEKEGWTDHEHSKYYENPLVQKALAKIHDTDWFVDRLDGT